MKLIKNLKRFGAVAGAGLLGLVGSAHAAIDVSSVTQGVSDATSAVAVVGAAVTGVYVGIKVFKWVRRAM